MKISFLIPPPIDGEKPAERTAGCTHTVYPMPNIYELIVAAVLEQAGHEVYYHDFVLKNADKQSFKEFLLKDDSKIYFIWSVNLSIESDRQAQSLIRLIRPDALIVFEGPAPTLFLTKFLSDNKTVVIRGEPEMTAMELTDYLQRGEDWTTIDGISYLKDGLIKTNKSRELIRDLDILPFPARHLLGDYPFSNPKLKAHPYTAVLTSRNCPFQCIYCVPSSLTFARELEYKREFSKKPPISFRSTGNVVKELDLLAEQGYQSIAFIDDNFIVKKERLEIICETLKKHRFIWGCQARVDAITEDTARILGDSGCEFVDLGVESFNDAILDYIKKGIHAEDIEKGIALLQKYKVPVKLNILIGTSPLESIDTLKDTFRRVKKLKVSQVMFNIVAPFPGTEFYNLAKENGWIMGGDYVPTDVQRHSILNYPNLTYKQMERMLFRNNLYFFLRPSFIWMHIRKFKSFQDFRTAFKALKIKLFG
ncbi:MAG: radical SAM protein [Bacteroidales bacterium]|nr:B12-binding domain-containing radical SAM protein [Bacteroidales bacterium]